MASVKKIETTVGEVQISTASEGNATVTLMLGGMDTQEITLDESDLIEAVLEYAHERRIRRTRKTEAAKIRKPSKPRARKEKPNDMIVARPANEPVIEPARLEAFREETFA